MAQKGYSRVKGSKSGKLRSVMSAGEMMGGDIIAPAHRMPGKAMRSTMAAEEMMGKDKTKDRKRKSK